MNRVASFSCGKLRFHFCPECGCTVFFWLDAFPGMVAVPVGAFADPDFPAPVRTVWAENKHEWLPFPPAIPRHPRNP